MATQDPVVRPAAPEERLGVRRLLNAGALEIPDPLAERTILAAVEAGGEDSRGNPLLGALVLDGERIAAIAVRPRRRGQGVGTALVAAAARRRDRLTARFDPSVRPFWASLGFAIEPVDGRDRLRGVRT